MIQDLVDAVQTLELNQWRIKLPVAFVLVAATTYLATIFSYARTKYCSNEDGQEPPVIPYWLPGLGSTIPFVRDTKAFIANTLRKWGDNTPYTVRLAAFKGYLITQPEHFGPLLKATRFLTNKKIMAELMRDVFGTPPNVMPMYFGDNSGIEPTPVPGTAVPSHQRIWQNQHADSAQYLTGEALRGLATRFTSVLSEAIASPNDSDPADSGDWVTMEDFYPWWRSRVFAAATTALFGPHLGRLNPTLEHDFWTFADAIPTLVKRYPAWMAPRAHAARTKMLDSVKKWHAHAREHSDYRVNNGDGGAPKWDEYWGSVWLKVRQRWGQDTGIMDDDGLASEDLALTIACVFIITRKSSHGANANAIPMAFWYLIEIYRDPALLQRVLPELEAAVQEEAASSSTDGSPAVFDLSPVLASPLAQSIYAEVLRMRISLLLNRCADRKDHRIGLWTLKKGAYMTLPTAHIGYHKKAWEPYTDSGKAPIDEFWADRFLVPDEEDGKTKERGEEAREPMQEKAEPKMRFSTEHLNGIWVPYGGGALMCPGRHFAKQEIMGSVTVFAHYYDLEVLSGRAPTMDDKFYGMGAQQPAEKTPVRIRRKVGGWKYTKQN
ncbi:cytochrome P450 [Decorospora gaudefroyi]|uniref:Cytochrome P450 n=1 Tax=Decorospora gaudefroyi TaxID=184978 RepID=A0A6A5JZH1_9PLEO|nr:cytochrome P450 [Decorospora gaudefroyi]